MDVPAGAALARCPARGSGSTVVTESTTPRGLSRNDEKNRAETPAATSSTTQARTAGVRLTPIRLRAAAS